MESKAFSCLLICMTTIYCAVAYDSDPLQDFCVADPSSGIKVTGFACKADATVTVADFFFNGLANPGSINNSFGSVVTGANVQKFPGLNTMGVSMARIDFAPGGLNPPHFHPRATEVIFVLEGELEVGFITTANKLITQTLKKGEIFVLPRALIHFQKNNGDKPASLISSFNSQLPGTQSLISSLFSATPEVPDYILRKSFMIGNKKINKIKSRLAPKKTWRKKKKNICWNFLKIYFLFIFISSLYKKEAR